MNEDAWTTIDHYAIHLEPSATVKPEPPFRFHALEEEDAAVLGQKLVGVLAAADQEGLIVEHLATQAALGPDGRWRYAAQVVTRRVEVVHATRGWDPGLVGR